MEYTCGFYQFGTNEKVPTYETNWQGGDGDAPIPPILTESDFNPATDNYLDKTWFLVFSYRNQSFIDNANHPIQGNGDNIKSYYAKYSNGSHHLTTRPYLIGEQIDEAGFGQYVQCIEFTEDDDPSSLNSVCTDNIVNSTVTGTAINVLPNSKHIISSVHSTNQSIIIVTQIQSAVFDHFFVYAGSGLINNNQITVNKEQSCYTLSVYKTQTATSSHEVGTIPKWKYDEYQWPIILTEAVRDVISENTSHIFEHMSAIELTQADAATLKKGIATIDARMQNLESVKAVMTSLSRSKGTSTTTRVGASRTKTNKK